MRRDCSSSISDQLQLANLALALGFVDAERLLEIIRRWSSDKRQPLGEMLVELGAIDESTLQVLEALVGQRSEHWPQGDPSTPDTVATQPAADIEFQKALEALGDEEISQTLHADPAFRTRPAAADATHFTDAAKSRFYEQGAGEFRVLHLHAAGGLGEVWLAEDLRLNRTVALKEIRSKHADEPQNRVRFLQEAEITGRLEHPGIVPVYALGERADGRPYYVMRFIRGDSMQQAIDQFHSCEPTTQDNGGRPSGRHEHQPSSLRQLLARFVDVCEAVAYAHSRGVLHRDLKPGNVMLGNYGETLVVDWGLAKSAPRATTDDASPRGCQESMMNLSSGTATRLGSAIGTPGYMSPEQAGGRLDDLSVATDVYSLGATLFCLLTGRPAFVRHDGQDILKATEEGNFPSPRSLNKLTPPALNSAVLRAMALDPADRYASARELAQDVQRYLDDEPVTAHRDSHMERAGRWIRRRRRSVAASVAALAFVAVAAIIASVLIARSRDHAVQLARANAELAGAESRARADAEARQSEAERQKERAEKYYTLAISTVDEFLTGVSEDERLKVNGLAGLRKDLLTRARDFYDVVIAESEEGDDPLYQRRATAQERLGMISQETGDYRESATSLRVAMQLRTAMGFALQDPDAYFALLNELALAMTEVGEYDEAAQLWQDEVKGLKNILKLDPHNGPVHDLLATSLLNVALLIEQDDPAEAIRLCREGMAHVQQAMRQDPANFAYFNTKAMLHNNLAKSMLELENVEEAATQVEAAIALWSLVRLPAEGAEADRLDDRLALATMNQAIVFARRGTHSAAALQIEDALELRQQVAQQHPDVVEFHTRLADLQRVAGIQYRTLDRYSDSVGELRNAIEGYSRLHRDAPDRTAYRAGLATSYHELGISQIGAGATEHGIESFRKAIDLAQPLVESEPDERDHRSILAKSYHDMARALLEMGQTKPALDALESAITFYETLLDGPRRSHFLIQLAEAQVLAAGLLAPELLNEPARAGEYAAQAFKNAGRLIDREQNQSLPPSLRRAALVNRAEAATALGRFDEGLSAWDRVIASDGGLANAQTAAGKLTAFVRAQRFDEGIEMARAAAVGADGPHLPFEVAKQAALWVAQLERFDLPSEVRLRRFDQCGEFAVEMLRLAIERGYFKDRDHVETPASEPAFHSIRSRPDFIALLEDL